LNLYNLKLQVMNNIKVISYGGYYSTGGSVVRDIFREFEPNLELPTEFRLLKERFGLLDLERTLLQDLAPETIDLAIQDFIWLTTNFARKSGRLKKAGFSYDAFTNGIFSIATNKFIEEISDYHYPMSWHFYDFKRSYLSQLSRRFNNKVFTKDVRVKEGDTLATMAYPEKEAFMSAARKYIHAILSGIQEVNGMPNDSVVGLHNAIPCFSTHMMDRCFDYFSDCKFILTDRDPRDVFLNYPKDSYGRYLPQVEDIMIKAKSFAHFYKSIRKNQKSVSRHPNVLFFHFEDICENYDEIYDDIIIFSGLDKTHHKNRGKIFSPQESIKNVGMWRNATGDLARAVSYIEEELEDFIYLS